MADTKFSAATVATAPAAADLIGITQSSTDKSATFALWGGLEANAQTVTTTDVTGAVGQMYVCTIAGLTANRNLTLPSAQVGERVGVYIVDGDATYELILKGATSQTINGGSAATEWSRLFIIGECVIFRCTAANTWIVESDGRIPCQADVYCSTNVTTNTAAAITIVDFSANTTTGGDNASLVDSTNDVIKIRRANTYHATASAAPVSGLADTKYYAVTIRYTSGSSQICMAKAPTATATSGVILVTSKTLPITVGNDLEWGFQSEETDRGLIAQDRASYFSVTEVL